MPEIADDFLIENSTDDAQLELLHRLEPKPGICVPLRARGRILGTLVFVSSRGKLRYGSRGERCSGGPGEGPRDGTAVLVLRVPEELSDASDLSS